MLGPQIKFNENNSCVAKSNDRKTGAIVVVGLGIKKTSLVSILKRSASICKAPLRPISVGPIRRWTNESSLRSSKTTNSVSKTTNKEVINANSCKTLTYSYWKCTVRVFYISRVIEDVIRINIEKYKKIVILSMDEVFEDSNMFKLCAGQIRTSR